jgi:PAS domain S-box-containing protein
MSERAVIRGHDEIAMLARNINGMLSALQKAELELNESMQRYRSIFETAGAAMAIWGEDMVFTLVNTEFLKLSGYSREEVQGRMSWGLSAGGIRSMRGTPAGMERHREDHTADRHGGQDKVSGRVIRDILLNVDRIPGSEFFVASARYHRGQANQRRLDASTNRKNAPRELENEIASRIEYTGCTFMKLRTPLTDTRLQRGIDS